MYYSCYDKEDEYHDKIKHYRYNQTIQGLFIHVQYKFLKSFMTFFVTPICVNTIFFKFERVKWDHYISLQLSQTGKLQCRHAHILSLCFSITT